MSRTAAVTTENIDKEEISSSYTVTPSFDTEIGTVDLDTDIQAIYDTIRQGETGLHGKNVGDGLTQSN